MAKKPVTVTRESDSGRNERFRDPNTGKEMTRGEFANRIERGEFPDYHIRNVGGKRTPASNPDGNKKNNLD
ncbi:MAG: hypothetical protein RID81_24445 [Sandaracinaceae bacterium]